jgi:poly-gamma-glutamate synthesis protein (capsule biosynthesis protein)
MRLLARYTVLVLLVGVGHLLLLWLWNPVVWVPAPRVIKIRGGAGGAGARADGGEGGKQRAEGTPSTPITTLIFGGDTAPTDAATPTLRRRGYEYPFTATLGLLRGADLAVVNLEAAVTESDEPFPLYKRYKYKVHPDAVAAMKWAGVSGVTLANNHVLDYRVEGFLETLAQLERADVVPIGGGSTAAEARRGVVFDVGGTRVGVLSYMEDTLMHSIYVRSFAGLRSPGCPRLSAAALKRDLGRLRSAADVVVVSPHWGRNYDGVTLHQRIYARLMIDYGADVVIGHGPHIHQPVGAHRGRPILYSLGNYAFGTPGRDWFRHGLLARLRIQGRRLRRVELIPILTQNRIIRFKPERVTGADAREMLRGLARESAPLGARLRLEGDVAVFDP